MLPGRSLAGPISALLFGCACQLPDQELTASAADSWLDSEFELPGDDVERIDCFLGVVVAMESVQLTAPLSERVRDIHVTVGDSVEDGDLLLELDSQEAERRLHSELAAVEGAQANLRRAEADLLRATAKARRAEALRELLSRDEIETAQHQLETARVSVIEAHSRLRQREALATSARSRLSDTRVRAPFSGRVAAVQSVLGSHVTEGTSLVRIIRPDALEVRFAVPVELASSIHVGQEIRLEVEDHSQSQLVTIDAIAPAVDSATQMLFAESLLPSSTGQSILDGTTARLSTDLSSDPCPTLQTPG